MILFRLRGYHGFCWAYLAHIYILYQTQFQSYQNVVVALFLTGNDQIYGSVKSYYWIICRCRRRTNNRPTIFDGSFLPPPYCANHRIWRKGRERAKEFFKRRRMDENFECFARMDITLGNMKAHQ